jgi:hypothetical protein
MMMSSVAAVMNRIFLARVMVPLGRCRACRTDHAGRSGLVIMAPAHKIGNWESPPLRL